MSKVTEARVVMKKNGIVFLEADLPVDDWYRLLAMRKRVQMFTEKGWKGACYEKDILWALLKGYTLVKIPEEIFDRTGVSIFIARKEFYERAKEGGLEWVI